MLLIVYLLLMGFFSIVDIYHQYFFTSGVFPVIYNAARLIYIFYFIWIYYAVGDAILSWMGGSRYRDELSINTFLLGFITGAGGWHAVLFAVGFAGFYQHWLMVLTGFVVCLLSFTRFSAWCGKLANHAADINWLGVAIIAVPMFLFLMVKGLYPAGGHDYYNHYFQYYRSVTESGSLWPNAVWYHFYYNKGDALYFMAMLMTDPLGPQLAATAFILMGAVMVYSLLQQKTVWRQLPWIGVALYFTCLIYTPGPVDNMNQGGWGDLEKPHEPAAMMLLALVWLLYQLSSGQNALILRVAMIAAVTALVFISPTMAPFAGLFLMLSAVYFVYHRDWPASLTILCGMVTAGVLLIANFGLNFLLTGIPDDQALMLFFPVINFNKVSQWGVLSDVLNLYHDKSLMIAQQVSFSSDLIFKIVPYLRLDVWWSLFFSAISVFMAAFCWRPLRLRWLKKGDALAIFLCVALFATVIIFSLAIGRDQPISYYRYTSFVYAPMLCFCLLLLSPLFDMVWARVSAGALAIFFAWLVISQIPQDSLLNNQVQAITASYRMKNIKPVLANSLHFISGQYSIADAYKNQQGWPGRMPWGGVYPPLETVWKLLPAKTRIWSMNIHSYCMLPDCYMEGFHSFSFTRHPLEVYFGAPAVAKKVLQSENLNYFFIAGELSLEDMLPFTPLFSPLNISENFGVAWSDGKDVLLTWKEQAVRPIDSVWLTHYNHQVSEYAARQQFPLSYMKNVLTIMKTNGSLKPSDVSWNTSNIKG